MAKRRRALLALSACALLLVSLGSKRSSLLAVRVAYTFEAPDDVIAAAAKKKPTLVFHVGLPKTATTFLQCVLCRDENHTAPLLLQDGYVYLGTCSRSFCEMEEQNPNFFKHRVDAFFEKIRGYDGEDANPWGPVLQPELDHREAEQLPPLSEKILSKLEYLEENQLNGLIIYEGAHRFSGRHIAALANATQDRFDVEIVVAYRRLSEWLPSKYNSRIKWRGNDHEWTNATEERHVPFHVWGRGTFSYFFEMLEWEKLHPAAIVARNYQEHFTEHNVTIMDLHHLWTSSHSAASSGGDPLLQHLFCKAISNAPHTCRAAIQDQLGRAFDNPSWDLSFDGLVLKAYQRGWVPPTNYRNEFLERSRVAERAKRFFQAVQRSQQRKGSTTVYQRPIQCLPSSVQNRIINLSVRVEKKLLGDHWSPAMQKSMEEEHRLAFQSKREKLVCWIDTETMLSEQLWKDFFRCFQDEEMDHRLHQLYV